MFNKLVNIFKRKDLSCDPVQEIIDAGYAPMVHWTTNTRWGIKQVEDGLFEGFCKEINTTVVASTFSTTVEMMGSVIKEKRVYVGREGGYKERK